MIELITGSSFFWTALTVCAYCIGVACQKKWKKAFLNPILIGAGLLMMIISVGGVSVEDYQKNTKLISWLLTPATICLAISFAEQLSSLKGNLVAVFMGVLAGTVCSIFSVWAMAKGLGLTDAMTASLLPKNVTSAIGVPLCLQAGGVAAITTVVIVLTGILGNMIGPMLCKLFRITNPIAQGVAFGTAAHVIGASKAMEMSPVAGAVSSLSLTLAGLLTTVIFSFMLGV